MSRPKAPVNLETGVVFTIAKGNRKARWKIIHHPEFANAFALVHDHPYLTTYEYGSNIFCYLRDLEHICGGSTTLERTWQQAYDCT